MYNIIDNFLNEDQHKAIKETLMGDNFPWFFNNYKLSEYDVPCYDDKYNFQFTHMFYTNNRIHSQYYDTILPPLLQKINPLCILRIKANLNTHTETPLISGYHVDYEHMKHKTAVYYVNTNNGKTIFKDGDVVDSVENRLLVFDTDMLHSGISCTDSKVRCIINFNYVER